jgi:hypothetical protein
MQSLNQAKAGMACLAITHSLPIASLIWSCVILSTSSRAFTLFLHDSRIVLFSAALAVQIFGPKERATVTTLSVECFIIVLCVAMGLRVVWLLSGKDGVDDVDASTEQIPALTGSQHDIEQGSGN